MLSEKRDKNYRIYWFGSKPGVAIQAFEKVNALGSASKAVGYYYPGYDSVETMSTEDILKKINAAHSNLLLLSLSAKKGVIWIERNKAKLNANILCHIGAVMDFIAGSVRPAPPWVRQIGCEWIWKAILEPYLW